MIDTGSSCPLRSSFYTQTGTTGIKNIKMSCRRMQSRTQKSLQLWYSLHIVNILRSNLQLTLDIHWEEKKSKLVMERLSYIFTCG